MKAAANASSDFVVKDDDIENGYRWGEEMEGSAMVRVWGLSGEVGLVELWWWEGEAMHGHGGGGTKTKVGNGSVERDEERGGVGVKGKHVSWVEGPARGA